MRTVTVCSLAGELVLTIEGFPADGRVDALRRQVAEALGSPIAEELRLVLGDRELIDAESLPSGPLAVTLIRARRAFRAVCWGDAKRGGRPQMPERLSGLTSVRCTDGAFAAIDEAGAVVCWGDCRNGGLSPSLTGVVALQSTASAFAALKADGSVCCWGSLDGGGEPPADVSNVASLHSTERAFAALTRSGAVVAWGHERFGGETGDASAELQGGVSAVFSNATAFAAVKSGRGVVSWGNLSGDVHGNGHVLTSAAPDDILDRAGSVCEVVGNQGAFAALTTSGHVLTWGHAEYGGDSSSVAEQLSGDISCISCTAHAFAALTKQGSVVTWGDPSGGGDASAKSHLLGSGIVAIHGNVSGSAFAALSNDGAVVTWGDATSGGDSSSVSAELNYGVQSIHSNGLAFAAVKNDAVVTWGLPQFGGDSSSVRSQLTKGVKAICSTAMAFAALLMDGSVVVWGTARFGGDVPPQISCELKSGVVAVYGNGGAFVALKY